MNNRPRLSESGIEYLDYAWNFFSGCTNWANGNCGGGGQEFNCWAKSITERFADHYPNGFKPTLYPEALLSPMSLKKPSIIGCAFMGDLFLDEMDPEMIVPVSLYGELKEQTFVDLLKSSMNPMPAVPLKEAIYSTIRCCPQHTFLFLTKCPWNLPKWSPFPGNCRVGVTATNDDMFWKSLGWLRKIEAKVKYISLEPLLEQVSSFRFLKGIVDWVIIGAQTNPYKPPKIEWIQEIVEAADKAGVAVFLKENLSDLIPINSDLRYGPAGELRLRQELPNACTT